MIYLRFLTFGTGKAYHDMATFNSADGTGGMDASVRLERDRAEVRHQLQILATFVIMELWQERR